MEGMDLWEKWLVTWAWGVLTVCVGLLVYIVRKSDD